MRIAMTETCNVYPFMPESVDDLPSLASKLEPLRSANVEHHVTLLRVAAQQGAKVIGFGELFAGPYFALTKLALWRDLAEDAREGPTVTRLREAAREHSIIVVAPIYEKDRDSDTMFNTAVVIDDKGDVLGCYRKTHIPQGTNEKGTFSERFYYDASDGGMFVEAHTNSSPHRFFPVFETSVGRIGVAICYDRHFEGVMRSLAEGGAELVFSPAVTFGDKSQRLWHHEFVVDATRHNVFIAGSNRSGREKPWNVAYFGESYVVGPNGRLDNMSSHPELVIADVDLASLRDVDPAGWRLREDRRNDIYGR